jgi:membrane peptidoglycan carboxypeptidase
VLDPRVNFLVVTLMEDVLRFGTGAGAYRRGFTLPAAAKTGTSQDAWFGGFTSKLLCIVWVGLDDYKDLKDGWRDGGDADLGGIYEARASASRLPRRYAVQRCPRAL